MKNLTVQLIIDMLELMIKGNKNKAVNNAIGYAYANKDMPLVQFIEETASDIGLYYNKLATCYNTTLRKGKAHMINVNDTIINNMDVIQQGNPVIKCMYTIVNNCK